MSRLARELFMQPRCKCLAIVHVIAQRGRLEHVINPREEQGCLESAGEVVETKRGNHKRLNAWKGLFGDEVENWLVK